MNKGQKTSLLIPLVCIFLLCFSINAFLTGQSPAKKLIEAEDTEILIGPEYIDHLLPSIKNAKERIWVLIYLISHKKGKPWYQVNQLLSELVRKHREGVDVRIYMDIGREWNPKRGSMSGPLDKKNKSAYEYLKKNGVPVHFDPIDRITHAKFQVIDEDIVFIGSNNWSYSSLSKNLEACVFFRSRKFNAELAEVFLKEWNKVSKK